MNEAGRTGQFCSSVHCSSWRERQENFIKIYIFDYFLLTNEISLFFIKDRLLLQSIQLLFFLSVFCAMSVRLAYPGTNYHKFVQAPTAACRCRPPPPPPAPPRAGNKLTDWLNWNEMTNKSNNRTDKINSVEKKIPLVAVVYEFVLIIWLRFHLIYIDYKYLNSALLLFIVLSNLLGE